MEKNLKNFRIYRANFKSVIGDIYYLWFEPENSGKTGAKSGLPARLCYLGNREDSFENYIRSLKGLFCIEAKKSAEIEKNILDYLSGRTKNLKLDICFLSGSDFEKKVWNAAISVLYGNTLSYRQLAEKAGFPLAWRAVGTALGNNPVMLAVPCHRIIKSDGSIGKFGGGTNIKEFLLNLEAKN